MYISDQGGQDGSQTAFRAAEKRYQLHREQIFRNRCVIPAFEAGNLAAAEAAFCRRSRAPAGRKLSAESGNHTNVM